MLSRIIAAALLTAACVDTSVDRVKLTTTIDHVSLSVAQGTLVSTLSGGFDWVLDVGDLASGDDVIAAAPSFQLAGGTGAAVVLDAVPSTSFPLTLKSGESLTVHFTLNDQKSLAAADVTSVCAGPVQVVASFRDTLGGDRATSVDSDATTVAGCP